MTTIGKRIQAFVKLGEIISEYLAVSNESHEEDTLSRFPQILHNAINSSLNSNPWFIRSHIKYALSALKPLLKKDNLTTWINQYSSFHAMHRNPCNVGVIMAGNIPLVGFHDFLCVLISGHKFTGKLSSDDGFLLPAISKILIEIENDFSSEIKFEKHRLYNADAVIATGSNNTARYFEHHYGNKRHIFRKNRNGVAVLSGSETEDQLSLLAQDIYMHFGLGCRNVSKLYLPFGYNFSGLLNALNPSPDVQRHSPYLSNYLYNKAIMKLQKIFFHDNEFILLRESSAFTSPVAVLHYEFYGSIDQLNTHLTIHSDQIQCIVSDTKLKSPVIDYGKSQEPKLTEYADGIDTMQFLESIVREK